MQVEGYTDKLQKIKGVHSCNVCGEVLKNTMQFCTKCGTKQGEEAILIPPTTKQCAKCGNLCSVENSFCSNCGNNLNA